jgi:hypothetical protein
MVLRVVCFLGMDLNENTWQRVLLLLFSIFTFVCIHNSCSFPHAAPLDNCRRPPRTAPMPAPPQTFFVNAERGSKAYPLYRDAGVVLNSKFAYRGAKALTDAASRRRLKQSVTKRGGLWELLSATTEAREAGGVGKMTAAKCRECVLSILMAHGGDTGGEPKCRDEKNKAAGKAKSTTDCVALFCCGTVPNDRIIMCDLTNRRYCVGVVRSSV